MSKRSASSAVATAANAASTNDAPLKRLKEDVVLQDSPIGDDFDDDDDMDNVEEIEDETVRDGESSSPSAAAEETTNGGDVEEISFQNILNNVRKQSNAKGKVVDGYAAAIRKLNEHLPEIHVDGADMDLFEHIKKQMSEEIPLVFPVENANLAWRLIEIMKMPTNEKNDNDNDKIVKQKYHIFMELFRTVTEKEKNDEEISTLMRVNLYNAACIFFNSVIGICGIKSPHANNTSKKQTLFFLEPCNKTYELWIKRNLECIMNPSCKRDQLWSKDNPLFEYNACAVVLCKMKDVKVEGKTIRISALHSDTADFLSPIFYDVAVQLFPKLKREITTRVYFNVTPTTSTKHFAVLDSKKLKKIDPDLHIAHVTISRAFCHSFEKGVSLVVVLYVNYFIE